MPIKYFKTKFKWYYSFDVYIKNVDIFVFYKYKSWVANKNTFDFVVRSFLAHWGMF